MLCTKTSYFNQICRKAECVLKEKNELHLTQEMRQS